MHLTQFRISNYKCFHEPDAVELKSGFNVFTGKNSTGKSALIQALSFQLPHNPHISIHTKPTLNSQLIGSSTLEFTVQMDATELRSAIERSNAKLEIPFPSSYVPASPEAVYHNIISVPNMEFTIHNYRLLHYAAFNAQPIRGTGDDKFITFVTDEKGNKSFLGGSTTVVEAA